MYTLEIPGNTIYSVVGTLPEIMDKLASEFISSNRATDGYESFFEAVWPTDPAELDEGEQTPDAAPINEENVIAFAAKAWDTHPENIQLHQHNKTLTRGEFQAMMHHLGLGHETLGEFLDVSGKTVSRWIYGYRGRTVPVGVIEDMEALLDRHDSDVEKIRELDARGVIIVYPEDKDSQQIPDVPLGWELRVLQRAVVEHGVTIFHQGETFSGIDYSEG